MKATELMIGNWVQSPKSGKYFKAENIYGGNNEAMHCISAKTADGEFCNKGLWNPIPISPEILEKNGFVNVYRGRYRFDDNKGSIVEISTINGVIKCVRVSKYDSDDIEDTLAHFTSYEIKHLHELQNALTLCKIEKEVQL